MVLKSGMQSLLAFGCWITVVAGEKDWSVIGSSVPSSKLCAVHGKPVEIGTGISGENLVVDVGHCLPRNGKWGARTATQKNPNEQLEESGTKVPENGCNGSCVPSILRYERHTTRKGLVEIPVVTDCACATLDGQCTKEEKLSTFHPGTPFETTIDMGACHGGCIQDNSSCNPIRNRTLAIEGPNGFSSIPVIEQCACRSSCYRTSKLEHIFDYSNVLDGDGKRIANVAPDVKIIDIGDCSGGCNGEAERKCAIWSTDIPSSSSSQKIPPAYQLYAPPGPKKCLAYLTPRQKKCTPVEYAAHLYTDRYGLEKTVISVASCGCH